MSRHHVVRQLLLHVRAQRFVRRRPILRPQIRNDAHIVWLVFAHDHYSLGDGRMGCEMRFDLAQLYAVAAHFHLLVGPANEMYRAALVPAHQIAGAIHPAVGCKRVRQKAFAREFRSLKVAARYAVATNEQLAWLSCRYGPPRMIENIELRIRNRRSQGNDAIRLLADHRCGRPDGGFRGTVHVINRRFRHTA